VGPSLQQVYRSLPDSQCDWDIAASAGQGEGMSLRFHWFWGCFSKSDSGVATSIAACCSSVISGDETSEMEDEEVGFEIWRQTSILRLPLEQLLWCKNIQDELVDVLLATSILIPKVKLSQLRQLSASFQPSGLQMFTVSILYINKNSRHILYHFDLFWHWQASLEYSVPQSKAGSMPRSLRPAGEHHWDPLKMAGFIIGWV